MRDLKQKLMDFWNSSKFFRVYFYTLSIVAVLAFVAFGVLSLLAKDRVETAQVLFERDISKSVKPNDETQKLENYVFVVKLHHFTSYIFRHQRNISLVKNTDFTWSKDINTSVIISIKQETSGTDANKFFQIQTSQDLNALRYTTLGTAQYETSFAPLPKSIVEYYLSLLVLGFVFIILWRYSRKASLYALAFIVFCLVILSLDGAKIEQLHLVPFGLIAFALFAVCVFGAWRVKNSRLKLFLAYFSVIPLCLGIAEFWLFFSQDKTQLAQPHYILGFANTPLYNGKAKYIVDDKIVYDISYTHDGYGNRITPNNNENSKKCIAIYGGSFVYGSAIDNNETLAYFLAKELPDFRLLNFGISAAGAHTVLARLEFKIDSEILAQCDELISIYEAIPHHIDRAYGAYLGPNYQLNVKNKPAYWGTYKEGEYARQRFWEKQPPKITPKPQHKQKHISALKKFSFYVKNIFKFKGVLDKSYIQQSLTLKINSLKSKDMIQTTIYEAGYYSHPYYIKFAPNEIGLYFVIVKRIQDELKAQYGVPLYIVLWDYDMHAQFLDKYDTTLKANFRQMGVPFYALSEMIEDYPQDLERVKRGDYDNFKYRVSRWDTHPNALANEKIAEFLATKIKNGEIKSHKIKGAK